MARNYNHFQQEKSERVGLRMDNNAVYNRITGLRDWVLSWKWQRADSNYMYLHKTRRQHRENGVVVVFVSWDICVASAPG